MYSASTQFHNAVFANSPVERVLFKFADGTIFTNEDIHIGSGLKLIEAVNLEEELTIGGCPASSLEATIMNYHGLLSGFAFGEAEVSLGVRTDVGTIAPVEANVLVVLRYEMEQPLVITGHDTIPYLRVNGDGPTVQPPFPVKAIMAMDNTIFCINDEGEVWQAAWIDGLTWNQMNEQTWQDLDGLTWDDLQNSQGWNSFLALVEFNAFMKNKFKKWAEMHTGTSYNGNVSYEFYVNGTVEKYEYIKLGTFLLNTPTKRKVNLISVSALDKMSLFDKEADAFWNGLTYPITIGEIFTQLCVFVGVPQATVSFMNNTRSFSEAPMVAEGITAREILGWIAEAACSFARMTRDGEVELAWFGVRPVSIPMTQYFSIAPAEYEVAQVDKLQISGSETDIGVVIGEGTNGYQILDNPLLYGATDTEVRTLGVPIYNRLIAYAPFSPIVATAVCDWSIQAGDIIEIVLNGVTYALPVYSQTITWKGNARVSYESSGAEKRPVMAASNRRVYAQKRAIHEVNETVDGLTRRIEDTEGNVANLELFADSLTLSIANGSTSSTLKLKAGSTELTSADITFTGFVTFSNLTDGTTTISGGNITTGTVAAARIDVDNLYVKHLSSADGTFHDLTTIDSATGYGMQLYWSSIRFTKNSGSTWSGQIDVDATYGMRLFSSEDVNIYTTGSGKWVNVWGSLKVSTYAGESRIVVANPATASGGTECRWVDRTGDLGGWSLGRYTSSRKYKKDIEYFGDEYGIDTCRRFFPATFKYIDDDKGLVNFGLIAEDVFEVCPEVVSYHNGVPDSVQYSNMVALAISAIQNLDKRLTKLEGVT